MSDETYEGGEISAPFHWHRADLLQSDNQIDVDTKYPYGVYYSHQDVSELVLDKSGYLQVNNS